VGLAKRKEMSIGSFARRLLGPRLFPFAGRLYRAVFVDLGKVAKAAARVIPKNALVLDIGGGDGEPLNHLLSIRPDILVRMLDLSPTVGGSIRPEFASRVTVMPATSVRDYVRSKLDSPQAVILNDVVHHVPVPDRLAFFADIHECVSVAPGTKLIIKDIEPGHFRSRLSFWADRYITGDRSVRLVSRSEMGDYVRATCGSVDAEETSLYREDCPNYMIAFTLRPD
jgi:hypothetical protein